METKELRKSLRHVLEGLQKEQTSLEALLTEENKKIFRQYPSVDGAWKHPNSHYFDRINEYITNARKLIEKVIQALPRERKKKGEKRTEPLSTKPKARKARDKNGDNGYGNKRPKAKTGVAPVPQERKKRGRPKKS